MATIQSLPSEYHIEKSEVQQMSKKAKDALKLNYF